MAEHNDFGKAAEQLATEYLQQKGYRILARNFYYQKAEIDIIAMQGDTLVVAEVKARRSDAVLHPMEAVNRKKIGLLVAAADHYIGQHNISAEVRFDIISILMPADDKVQIEHMVDAFGALEA